MLGCVEATTMTLNRLLNADNECVGYFTDDDAGRAAMQSAQADWDAQAAEDWSEDTFSPAEHRRRRAQPDACPNKCRSSVTPIKPLDLEDVEPGDGDRVAYHAHPDDCPIAQQMHLWLQFGAAFVEIQRYEINRYRRPGKSHRSADLGGPEQAADVLYVLTIKAPK